MLGLPSVSKGLNPATMPAVLISATASPPVRYAMVSGVTVAPRRPRTVPNQSNVCARSKLVARSPIPRIADGAGTNEGRGGVLRRELDVGLDAGHQPAARHPVIAALKAGDHAVEIVGGTGGEQRRACGIAEHRIGLRFSRAVAGVDSDIRPGPAPCD